MKKQLVKFGSAILAAAPLLALAQVGGIDIIAKIKQLLNGIVPILMTLALIYFIWGLIKYIQAAAKGDSEESKHGKAIMIWGIVALFVMASVWGLVAALGTTLGIQTGTNANQVVNPTNLIPQ
jgi:uncharacterized membrane protein YfcA